MPCLHYYWQEIFVIEKSWRSQRAAPDEPDEEVLPPQLPSVISLQLLPRQLRYLSSSKCLKYTMSVVWTNLPSLLVRAYILSRWCMHTRWVIFKGAVVVERSVAHVVRVQFPFLQSNHCEFLKRDSSATGSPLLTFLFFVFRTLWIRKRSWLQDPNA